MNKEHLQKTISIIREYNEDLFTKTRSMKRIVSGKSKLKKQVSLEEVEEALILISVLLSGNIKLRYDTEEFIRENKGFATLTQLKTLANDSKHDLEALKSLSFTVTELAKIIRHKEEEQNYKDKTL